MEGLKIHHFTITQIPFVVRIAFSRDMAIARDREIQPDAISLSRETLFRKAEIGVTDCFV